MEGGLKMDARNVEASDIRYNRVSSVRPPDHPSGWWLLSHTAPIGTIESRTIELLMINYQDNY
jgi:hypothetical protein